MHPAWLFYGRALQEETMKLTITFALLGGITAWAAEPVALNMNTGEWEYTATTQMSGMPQASQMPQIPQAALDKMSPEQRAQMQAAMQKALGAMAGKPITTKTCIKKEDLSNFNPTTNKSCKMNITSSSRSKFEATMVCDTAENMTTTNITAETLSSTSVKFNVVTKGTASGVPVNMTVNGTGKWLSSTCTDK
jgi:hypothetical protein